MNKLCLVPLLLVYLLPTPASSQSRDIEKACIDATQHFLLAKSVKIGVMQSYPELSPPGVRFTYSTDAEADPAEIDDQVNCEFERPSAPFQIKKFCLSDECYSIDAQDPENRRRFQEVKALMDRKN